MTQLWLTKHVMWKLEIPSHFQPILQLNLGWPLTLIVTFDLINKCGFPCCIYDPSMVEIHQSMWKLEPNVNQNVNPFSQQTDNNRGQSNPYVSFLHDGRRHKKSGDGILPGSSLLLWPRPKWFSFTHTFPILRFNRNISNVTSSLKDWNSQEYASEKSKNSSFFSPQNYY